MRFTRSLLGAGAAVAVVAAVVCLGGGLAGRWGGDGWGVAGLSDSMQQERLRGEYLQERLDSVNATLRARQAVVDELLAGRLTLLEAAARYRDLDEKEPGFNWEHFRLYYDCGSDEERFCRQVIDFVRAHFEDPERAAAAAAPLEGELCEHLQRGALRLPAPAAGGAVPVRRLRRAPMPDVAESDTN
jgi:hypothetical protein